MKNIILQNVEHELSTETKKSLKKITNKYITIKADTEIKKLSKDFSNEISMFLSENQECEEVLTDLILNATDSLLELTKDTYIDENKALKILEDAFEKALELA